MTRELEQPWKVLRTSDPSLPRWEHTIPMVSDVLSYQKGDKIVVGGVVRTEVRCLTPNSACIDADAAQGRRDKTKVLYDTAWSKKSE